MANPHYIKSIVFQFLYFLYCVNVKNAMTEAAVLQINRIDGMCRGSNIQMQSFCSGIKSNVGRIFIANNVIIVKEDIIDNLKTIVSVILCVLTFVYPNLKKCFNLLMGILNATVDRCSSMENLDTCEFYHKYETVNYCKFINSEDGDSKIFKFEFNPPFRCPHLKGTYQAQNTTIDVTPLSTFLTEGWYWKIKIEVRSIETQKLMYCLKIDLHVTSK